MAKEYTKEDIDKAYKGGLAVGKAEGHNKPAPETRERLIALETNYNNFMEQNGKEHLELKDLILGIKGDLKEALEKIEKQKANKWVEDVLIWVGGAIGLGFIGIVGWIIVEAIKRWR